MAALSTPLTNDFTTSTMERIVAVSIPKVPAAKVIAAAVTGMME